MNKRLVLSTAALIVVFVGLVTVKNIVLAEQSGSSPESGVTSRIKTIYDSLVSLSHGSESAGGWGDWGAMWNRIRSAAEWVPTGDADEADVASGKLFYKDSRTQKTGTASLAPDWSLQSLQEFDDYRSLNNTGELEDDQAEESVWTETTPGVYYDSRTGLWWAPNDSSNKTNQFIFASCDYFTTTPRGAYAGNDLDCGQAINACASLSKVDVTGESAKTDWYLPSQKEMMQAYIDGIENQPTIGDFSYLYWSSTETSWNDSYAWDIDASSGYQVGDLKTLAKKYFCVRRD